MSINKGVNEFKFGLFNYKSKIDMKFDLFNSFISLSFFDKKINSLKMKMIFTPNYKKVLHFQFFIF